MLVINIFISKMKIHKLIILFLAITFCSGKSQQLLKSKNTRTFDIEKFQEGINQKTNENTTDDHVDEKFMMKVVQYKDQDSIVTLMEQNANFYKEERNTENEERKKIFTYYNSSYSLANEGEYFLGIPIGVHKKYSVDGKLMEEKNYDINEEGILSIPEMIKMMKNNFGINIEREDEIIGLDTLKEEGRYVWRIVCKAHPEKQIKHNYAYFFDAKTGVFIRKERYTLKG